MKLNEVNISSSAHDSEPDNKTAARCGGMVLYCRYKQTLQHRPFSAENCILQCVILSTYEAYILPYTSRSHNT